MGTVECVVTSWAGSGRVGEIQLSPDVWKFTVQLVQGGQEAEAVACHGHGNAAGGWSSCQ